MPLTIDVVSSVPIIGTISKPAAVALTPAAICRYVGRYPSTPNIDTPVKSPAMVVRLKLRSLNRCRGMIGSLACDSFHTNSAPVRSEERRVGKKSGGTEASGYDNKEPDRRER